MRESISILPSEVTHIESECEKCHSISIYDAAATKTVETLVCPYCGSDWPNHYSAIGHLKHALESSRRLGSLLRLRIVNIPEPRRP